MGRPERVALASALASVTVYRQYQDDREQRDKVIRDILQDTSKEEIVAGLAVIALLLLQNLADARGTRADEILRELGLAIAKGGE
ncbi:hypothetical protein ACWENQ_08255 [Nonomuraea sp. NPDC004354]